MKALRRERELLAAFRQLVLHNVGDDPGRGELGLEVGQVLALVRSETGDVDEADDDGVTQDQRETTSFWGTSGGHGTRPATSSWARRQGSKAGARSTRRSFACLLDPVVDLRTREAWQWATSGSGHLEA